MKGRWVGLVALGIGLLLAAALYRPASSHAPASCEPPDAAFSWHVEGLVVTFVNESTGTTPSYTWDFGDGGLSTEISPTHRYGSAGVYQVTLVALNTCGGDSVTHPVEVAGEGASVFLPIVLREFAGGAAPTRTPTRTLSPSATPGGPTLTASPSVTPSPSPSPSVTPSPTRTPSPSVTPGGPTLTPTRTRTPGPTAAPSFTVQKVGWPDTVYYGQTEIYAIGLSNGRPQAVSVTLADVLPYELMVTEIYHTCPEGSIISDTQSFQGVFTVPASSVCQLWVVTTVVDGCGCSIVNTVDWVAIWAGGGGSGTAESQPIYISDDPPPTATPTRTAPVVPTFPTNTPEPTPAPTAVGLLGAWSTTPAAPNEPKEEDGRMAAQSTVQVSETAAACIQTLRAGKEPLWTVEEVARRAGVPVTSVQAIEGAAAVPESDYQQVLQIFGLTLPAMRFIERAGASHYGNGGNQ